MTPFKLVYGKVCHLLVKVKYKAYWAVKQCNMSLAHAIEERLLELQELEELRLKAYENSRLYKEKMKLIHDKCLVRKEFKVGQKLLLFNLCLQLMPGKLKSKWLGPFEITNLFPYGVIEIRSRETKKKFEVNG
ncbi:uncharacterized protein LOC120089038 [Benincasa hispida]|uniref:uncharacterized protein LOC120089038 n=1 Tax=Benincasa hispida TaxID=102211 RepID=UPI0018FF308D|nr:uncharacterized protein LOC120089038 [Benincasa hispida]